MRVFLRLCISLIGFSCIISAHASKGIDWQLTESGDLFDIARTYQKQAELPDEVTLILQANDVHVADNHVTEHVKKIWFYPNARDVENDGDHSIYYNEKIERLTLLSIASMNSLGEVKSMDPSVIQVLDTDNSRSFSDSKKVVLTIPGLAGGSLSIIEYKLIRDLSKQESDWSKIHFTQWGYPADQFNLSINWPASKQLFWSSNSSDVMCKAEENQLLCSGSDIPAFKNDNNIYWRDHIGQIAIGELQNWQQVIDTSKDAMNKALSDTTGADELVQSITADSPSIDEKISKIHEFVARDIRYVSISELGHTITPHDVASVIKNRYGDCKDKSMLLNELLRRIGINSYPVLVATDRSAPEELLIPTLGYFNHVVICFDRQSQQHCLDATNQDTYWLYTPSWIQNTVTLPLVNSKQPSILANSLYRWQLNASTQITFNRDGGQSEDQKRQFIGEYASSMKNILLSRTEEERETWLTNQYHDKVTSLSEPEFDVINLSEMAPQLVINSRAKIKPFLDSSANLEYEENDAWLIDELNSMRLQNKHYDEHFTGLKLHTEYLYDTKGIWKITRTPPVLNFKYNFGSLRRQIELTPSKKLIVTTDIEIPEQQIKKNQLEAFNRFLDLLKQESMIRFNGLLLKTSHKSKT
ncbi:DUF3857 domain-containing transglutaminase family protein [Photobacterium chitinilyticum]|uniref:DUF3857 domain-containing protein n=1 Tax=Photobacterium chitinilyticum TaxID=2485123 RepID=A0A444JT29_9GAMM|nr:DUF3857 and transglutaminase domain-containing protein [Photobacterium chitinilyticum]RWX56292.1 DUF3857 domain-containing protein [Photobacterium chitinilyticum]